RGTRNMHKPERKVHEMSDKQPAHAIATHRYSAPAEKLFQCWTDPQMLRQWMFGIAGRDQEEILNVSIDAKVGGAFSFVIKRQGKELDHFGTYLELKRPNRIAFTWAAREVTNPPQKVDSSRVNIDIVTQGTGCEVTLTHELAPEWAHFAERAAASWKKM